jgi:hypothetical protein
MEDGLRAPGDDVPAVDEILPRQLEKLNALR